MRKLDVHRDINGVSTHRNRSIRCVVYEHGTSRDYVIAKFVDRKRWYLIPNYSSDEWTLGNIGPFKRLIHAYAAYRMLPCSSPGRT